MREDFKKNLVLLSRVAKEKKYAQEYLGLLARRGDLGSIRIGKRWYTTEEWFSEFLEDVEVRKVETKAREKISESAKMLIEEKESGIEKASFAERVKADEKVGIKKYFAKRQPEFLKPELRREEKVLSQQKEKPEIRVSGAKREETEKEEMRQPRKMPVRIITPAKEFETIDLRKLRVRKPIIQGTPRRAMNSPGMPEEERKQEISLKQGETIREWKTVFRSSSPDFSSYSRENPFSLKFAFSASAVLVLVLLFQIGWVYRDEAENLFARRSGTVAGAEDSKANLGTVKDLSNGYLNSRKNNIKENVSLSRVLLGAALEKNSAQEAEADKH